MGFAHPTILLLLALPIVMAAWLWTRREPDVVLPFDHGGVRSKRVIGTILRVLNLLPAVLLAVAIVVLAGPQRLMNEQRERQLTNIQFCLDVSGSMTAPFGDGTRYDGAMQAANEFIGFRKGDAFGLTIFGTEVLHWVPVTKDTSAIKLATPFLRPERMPPYFGGTLIGKALLSCHQNLIAQPDGDRLIILITDGYSADLGGGKALEVATTLAKDKIVVYVIQVADEPLPEDMRAIANITKGDVFAAGDPAALSTVFQHIDKMQAARLKPPTSDFADYFRPVALVGIAIGALHAIAMLFGLRYTPW